MARVITEQKTFSREQLEAVAKFSAQNEIVDGCFYVGEFQGQTASWNPDGSLTIVTRHVPGSLEEFKKTKTA